MYWRDSAELSRGIRWSLVGLRLLAFAGILFFFLDLEKRTEDREIKPSRTVLLVDTSQSMALRDSRVRSEFVHVQSHRPGHRRAARRRADPATARPARRGGLPVR